MLIIILIIVVCLGLALWWILANQKRHSQKVADSVNTMSKTDSREVQLKKLKQLRATGVIDDVDYRQEKRRIEQHHLK